MSSNGRSMAPAVDHEGAPPFLGSCRSVADYEKLEKIGEGTYGTVCQGHGWVRGPMAFLGTFPGSVLRSVM